MQLNFLRMVFAVRILHNDPSVHFFDLTSPPALPPKIVSLPQAGSPDPLMLSHTTKDMHYRCTRKILELGNSLNMLDWHCHTLVQSVIIPRFLFGLCECLLQPTFCLRLLHLWQATSTRTFLLDPGRASLSLIITTLSRLHYRSTWDFMGAHHSG